MTPSELLTATTADGVALAIERVPPAGARRGAVLLLHAMMTDARYFGVQRDDGFAQYLAARGLEVFVAEFRGHGRSTPPRAGERHADWSFDDLVELDLPAIVSAVPPNAAILGHSLGGLVACAAIGTHVVPPPAALVLAATNVWRGETVARRTLMRAFDASARMFGKVPARALGLGNTDEPPAYIQQLARWSRTRRWASRTGVDYFAALASITAPTHAVAGAGDRLCRPAAARDIAVHIPTCGKLRVVGRAHGDALDADHFTLFTRPELADLRDWIARAIGC